ncbi:MAG: outer membrane lipoprotein carrier protein LolA [Thermodesulfovibrionales bacterium]
MGYLRTTMVVLLVLFVMNGTVRGSDLEDKISRLQKAYEGVTDIRGSFIQKSTIKDLKRTDTYKGEFFIKPPLKMKWVYRGNAAQDIIVNNEAILIYKKGENQAYRARFDKETYGQTPVALLGGLGKISEEFTITAKGDELLLKPRKTMGMINSIRMVLSGERFPVRSFTIYDSRSNVIEIELKEVRVNTGLKDSLFDLSVPKGVNIFDQGL